MENETAKRQTTQPQPTRTTTPLKLKWARAFTGGSITKDSEHLRLIEKELRDKLRDQNIEVKVIDDHLPHMSSMELHEDWTIVIIKARQETLDNIPEGDYINDEDTRTIINLAPFPSIPHTEITKNTLEGWPEDDDMSTGLDEENYMDMCSLILHYKSLNNLHT